VERELSRVLGRAAALLSAALLGLCVLAPVASSAASLEGGQALNELSQGAGEEQTTSTESTTSSAAKESGNSEKTVFIGAGAAGVLLLVIAFVIVRDARRVAPAGLPELIDGRPGTDPAARRRNRRNKAKAARRQRKRNR